MKRILFRILGVISILLSIFIALYPFISNYLAGLEQQSDVVAYENIVQDTDDKELQKAYNEATEYNKSLLEGGVERDPFNNKLKINTAYKYEDMLTINGDIMATIEIPEIDVSLPIYHGTDTETLKKGVGHLSQTSLPIGGESTHAVITGHTGLPQAKLFTDLDILKLGDKFYIHSLGNTLAYKIIDIYVIKPDETETLKITEGKDYVTLITCTPYGVNTHRLAVRGERVPYTENEEKSETIISRTSESTWLIEYKKALILGAIILIITLIIFFYIRHRRKKFVTYN